MKMKGFGGDWTHDPLCGSPMPYPIHHSNYIRKKWIKMVYKCITVSVAQPARANPTLDSKSPCHGLSESVVKVSGTSKFARLDYREQWNINRNRCPGSKFEL